MGRESRREELMTWTGLEKRLPQQRSEGARVVDLL